MLADMVKAGKLPPLKERIPEEPVVLDRKGKYGGVMRSVGNAKDLFIWSPVKYGGGIQGTPLRLAPDLRQLGAQRPEERRDVEGRQVPDCHDAQGHEVVRRPAPHGR